MSKMLARVSVFLLGVIVLGACGSAASSQASAVPSTTTTTVPSSTSVVSTPASSTTTVLPPDFTRFIAAVDVALAETSYAGAALSDPEIFIATGQLFCELLDDGVTPDDILIEHLDALEAVISGEITEADATATGVVLGASTEIICPQHAG